MVRNRSCKSVCSADTGSDHEQVQRLLKLVGGARGTPATLVLHSCALRCAAAAAGAVNARLRLRRAAPARAEAKPAEDGSMMNMV